MSAGDVTARSVLELRESMIETTMDDRWCARSVCEDAIEALEASRAEVAAIRRQAEERESPDWVTVRERWWTVAQILANAWRRHPLTCGERDKLVSEWDALRSGEATAQRGEG